jgi:hypothetical protein
MRMTEWLPASPKFIPRWRFLPSRRHISLWDRILSDMPPRVYGNLWLISILVEKFQEFESLPSWRSGGAQDLIRQLVAAGCVW